MSDLISRQDAIDALQKEINKGIPPFDDVMGSIRCGVRLARNIIEDLPSAQPELIEQGAYVRGFEQGRTQGMIDNTIKAERTNADALDLQSTCNQLATDCISRQVAIDAINKYWDGIRDRHKTLDGEMAVYADCKRIIKQLPSAQPEIIRCRNCRWQKDQSGSTAWLPCRACVTPPDFYCGRAEKRTG